MPERERHPDDAPASTLRRGAPGYPRLLTRIDDPPAALYVRGRLPGEPSIAVVGSRECTAYGSRVAYRLAAELVSAGFAVVSGLARGVDAAAHQGALDAGGATVAVLPCGIDLVYPETHVRLAAHIARTGAVVTEFEPGTRVFKRNFVERNRIIAGLAVATVVVEAARRSGAKITAGYALQYNREVLAVPGPIGSPTSAGANELLAEGAAPCTGIESLLRQLPDTYGLPGLERLAGDRKAGGARAAELASSPRAVLEAIPETGACSVERLAAATALPIGELLAILTDMEVRGLIRSVGSQRYERV